MRPVSRRRWHTKFARFVLTNTAAMIARQITESGEPVGPKTIYHWVAGRYVPSTMKCVHLLRIARGKLTIEDIVRPSMRARRPMQRQQRSTDEVA